MDFEYLIIKDQTSAKDYFEYLSLSLAYFLKFFFNTIISLLLSLNMSNGQHTLHLMK